MDLLIDQLIVSAVAEFHDFRRRSYQDSKRCRHLIWDTETTSATSELDVYVASSPCSWDKPLSTWLILGVMSFHTSVWHHTACVNIWPPDGSRVQPVSGLHYSYAFFFTHSLSPSLSLLQRFHDHGKGQGKRRLLKLEYPWRGAGHPSAYMCYDQQVQARAQGVCRCGGQRQVWPVWTLQWSCDRRHTWLVWKRTCAQGTDNTSSYYQVGFSYFFVIVFWGQCYMEMIFFKWSKTM